jgi:hypothetical protein
MAEIKVEKKRSNNILPWILGLVLLALVVWGLSRMGNRDQDRTDNQGTANQGAAVIEVVDVFSVRAA